MRVLGFDTSSQVSAVALAEDERVLAEDNAPTGLRHGDVLLSRIDALLHAVGWTPDDLELLAVGVGPGSFTGLRIGLATAKGLGLATGVALRGVCSLEVFARGALAGEQPVICLADAGKGEVFAAVYERDRQDLRARLAPRLSRPEVAARDIAALALRSATLCGSAAAAHAALLSDALGFAPSFTQGSDVPQGRHVAHAGRLAFLARGASDLASLEPSYLRGSDAKLPDVKLAL